MTPPHFQGQRRPHLRRTRLWHRLAYVTRILPRHLRQAISDLELPAGSRVLDYGCASTPYRRMFLKDIEYVGADLEGNPRAAVILNPDGTLPVASGSFDLVLSTQVLEHVANPARYLSECFRILRPGGRLLLSTHGIMIYHRDPVDYWRWTCDGLRRQVESAGFSATKLTGVMGLAATGLQLFLDATYMSVPRPLRNAFSLMMQGLIALSDRLQSDESRALNALVFIIVGEKPHAGPETPATEPR